MEVDGPILYTNDPDSLMSYCQHSTPPFTSLHMEFVIYVMSKTVKSKTTKL